MVVTDSTCNIPTPMIEGLPISVVPLHIIFNTMDIFLDGVTITPQEFYTRLREEKPAVSTSQPTPAAIAQRYSQLVDEGYDILSVHISSRLSGTTNSADQAKKSIRKGAIEIVDSHLASLPLGYVVLKTARAAADGASLADCKRIKLSSSHANHLFSFVFWSFSGGGTFYNSRSNAKFLLQRNSRCGKEKY